MRVRTPQSPAPNARSLTRYATTVKNLEGIACFLPVLFLPGCSTQTSVPVLTLPEPSMSIAAPRIRPVEASVAVSPPASRWTPDRINALEFFPEDVRVKLEPRSMPDNVRPISTKYPSDEECRSPHENYVLRCVTSEERGVTTHTLVLERVSNGNRTAIWSSEHPFEVMWSWEDDVIAINHRLDDGRMDLLVYWVPYQRIDSLPEFFPVDLQSLLSPDQFRSKWEFRAIGWARNQKLIVRGIGRDEREPYQDYGHEFVVNFSKASDSSATLIRAYRR